MKPRQPGNRPFWPTHLVLLFIPALICSSPARADDWPQWLGPQRDGIWRETGIVDKFPPGDVKIRWRTAIGPGYAGAAVANGRVYITDRVLPAGVKNPDNPMMRAKDKIPGQERVHCLNEADGKILWTYSYDCPYTISYPLGPRTTPNVYAGNVYTLGAEGHLACLNAESGSLVWAHELKKDYGIKPPIWGFSAHLLVDGNKVYCMVGGKGTAVVAFDKDTGKEIWRALTSMQTGYCPPMIYEAGGKRQLIAWHGEAINGLDPDTGKVYWTLPDVRPYAGMSISTPRKRDDLMFVTAAMTTAVMLRLDSDKPPKVVWKGDKKTTGVYSVFSTPLFENGYVYGSDNDGVFRCVKAATGERVWETMAPNNGKKARSGDTFIIKNGDRFFLVNEKGDLIIAHLSPKGYEELSRTHLLDPISKAWGRPVLWSHPAFANRSVYMRNDKEIICASLAAGQN
jgi:outer membrane protein assembly factor BamB